MPRIAIAAGLALIALGLGFYLTLLAVEDDKTSWTAAIPALVGLPLVVCGYLAHAKPTWRKHVMHVAVAIGLLGAIGGLARLPKTIGEQGFSAAAADQLLMALICLIFVALSIKSFINARRNTAPTSTSEPMK